MYINIGENNGSENYEQKKTVTSGKLIKTLYAQYAYVYISCTSQSGRLECNSLFVGLRGWGVRGNEGKMIFSLYGHKTHEETAELTIY